MTNATINNAPAADAADVAAPVAPAVTVLAAHVAAALLADGASAYEGEAALLAFAALFSPVMAADKTPGDYSAYVRMRTEWRRGYDAARTNVRNADEIAKLVPSDRSQDAFERRMRAAQSEENLGAARIVGTVPKSQSAAATAKAAQRAKPEGTSEQWLAKAAECISKGDTDGAAKAARNAKTLQAEANKAAKDDAAAKLRALKDEAREALRDLLATDDAKAIKAALAAIKKATPKKTAELAKV
jgi:hypothetical protein